MEVYEWNLAKALQSGEFLCFVMKALKESLIPYIHEGMTLTPFQIKENISFFLHAAEEFGVGRHRLFQVGDLFNLLTNNFYKVVECVCGGSANDRPTTIGNRSSECQRRYISMLH